jgi:glycosyltransferase involved in cell wall biosynthesis
MKILAIIDKNLQSQGGPVYLLRKQYSFFNKIRNFNLRIFETEKIKLINLLFYFFFKKDKIDNILKNVDILHFHVFWNIKNILFAYRAIEKKIPYLFSIHGQLDIWSLKKNFFFKKLFYFFFKKIFSFSSGYQMSTTEEMFESKKFCRLKNIFILSNGVDVNLDLGNNYKNSKIKKLIFLGRIHYKKGIEIFLESFNALSEIEKSSFTITIVGTGKLNYLNELKNKINFLNLSKYVKILPPLFNAKKKINLLKRFDLFFLTSYEEADSIAVKQAMACGLPVIISEQCRLSDVKKFNCGFVVKTTHISILKTLKKVYKIKNLSLLGVNSKKLADKNFNILKMNNIMLKIYSDIFLKKKNSPNWIVEGY